MGVLLQELERRMAEPNQSEALLEKMANIAVEKFLTSKEVSPAEAATSVEKTAQVEPVEETTDNLDKLADQMILNHLEGKPVSVETTVRVPEVTKEASEQTTLEEELLEKAADKIIEASFPKQEQVKEASTEEVEELSLRDKLVQKVAGKIQVMAKSVTPAQVKSTEIPEVAKSAEMLNIFTDEELADIMEKHAARFKVKLPKGEGVIEAGAKVLTPSTRTAQELEAAAKSQGVKLPKAEKVTTPSVTKRKRRKGVVLEEKAPSFWNTLTDREKQYGLGALGIGAVGGGLAGAAIAKD